MNVYDRRFIMSSTLCPHPLDHMNDLPDCGDAGGA